MSLGSTPHQMPQTLLPARPPFTFCHLSSSAPFDRIAEINFNVDADDDSVSSPWSLEEAPSVNLQSRWPFFQKCDAFFKPL